MKNGDRWTVTHVSREGALTVRHNCHRTVKLPRRLRPRIDRSWLRHHDPRRSGVSADTMHGLLTGQESRQQLYTMLTRGRHANHLPPSATVTRTL